MILWLFLIEILMTGLIRSNSTTPTYELEECPSDFDQINNTCYIFNETCTYKPTLPFKQYQEISELFNTTYRVEILRNPSMEYFEWYDILGKFGELFVENFSNIDDTNVTDGNFSTIGDNVNYYNGSFFSTDDNSTDQFCAYNTFSSQPKSTYCTLYDEICKSYIKQNTTNCHCRESTVQFCSLQCNSSLNFTNYDEEICSSCEEALRKYKEPTITMSLSFYRTLVFVSVNAFLKLLPLENDHNVYCFTDGNHSEHDVTYRFESVDIKKYNNTFNNNHYTINAIQGTIAHYWCKGFRFDNNLAVKSSTVIAQGHNVSESFTMNVNVNEDHRTYPLTIHEEVLGNVSDIIKQSDLNTTITDIKFLRLYERNTTLNVTKIAYRLYFNEINEFNWTMPDVLVKITSAFNNTEYNVSVGPSYCLPDTTHNNSLTWNKTLLGMTAISYELCLKGDSRPVTRKCVGEYLYGTYWDNPTGSCEDNNGSLHTIRLHELSHSKNSSSHKINELKKILTEKSEAILIDVHFMVQVINDITNSDEEIDLKSLIEVVSDVMDLNREVLHEAQLLLNTTDMLLFGLQKILTRYNSSGCDKIVSNNIFVVITNFSNDEGVVNGAAFYETNSKVTIELLINETNPEPEPNPNLKLKVFISNEQILQIYNKSNDLTAARLVITAFRDDSFFNEKNKRKTKGFLASVFVSGFEEPFLYQAVKIYVRPDRRYRSNFGCYSWEFGRNWQWSNVVGVWKNNSAASYDNVWVSCDFWIFKSYGIIVGDEEDVVLSIIASVGCGLSMAGSVAVVVTGTIYQNWREQSGTKILLNFVITNFFQNILLAANSGVDSAKQVMICIVMGASLHYSVLSQFTWMLIIGYMQYLRYVQVYYTIHTRFVLIASMVAWIVPVVPVVAILAWQPASYTQDSYCYLQDRPLFFAVFIPAAFSLVTNMSIVGIIVYHIYCKKKSGHRDNMSWLNLRLVILLFFLLGLYWIFGIAARFTNLVVFDFFFCISAGMQGVVIFLYFIVFNKMTRNFWMNQLKRSEMITAMQLWLQHRKRIGKVKLDKSEIRKTKIRIMENLNQKRELEKIA